MPHVLYAAQTVRCQYEVAEGPNTDRVLGLSRQRGCQLARASAQAEPSVAEISREYSLTLPQYVRVRRVQLLWLWGTADVVGSLLGAMLGYRLFDWVDEFLKAVFPRRFVTSALANDLVPRFACAPRYHLSWLCTSGEQSKTSTRETNVRTNKAAGTGQKLPACSAGFSLGPVPL